MSQHEEDLHRIRLARVSILLWVAVTLCAGTCTVLGLNMKQLAKTDPRDALTILQSAEWQYHQEAVVLTFRFCEATISRLRELVAEGGPAAEQARTALDNLQRQLEGKR